MASTARIESAQVRGRRRLRFENFEEPLADARQLAAGKYRALGNWSLGQALGHLGQAMQGSVDGGTFRVRWWLKIIGPIFIKPRLLRGHFPAGFKLPGRAERVLVPPNDLSFDEGLNRLQAGIERLRSTDQRGSHPVFGKLNVAEWDQLHLRHCELHLSFFVPEEPASDTEAT